MSCGCEFDSCGNRRRQCAACGDRMSAANRMTKAVDRIEALLGSDAELHRRIGANVAAALPSYANAEWLAVATSGDCEYEGALSKRIADAVFEAMRGEGMP